MVKLKGIGATYSFSLSEVLATTVISRVIVQTCKTEQLVVIRKISKYLHGTQ